MTGGGLMSYAEVIVDIATEQVDRVFTYRVPPALEGKAGVGYRVRIPFGPREKEGYILRMKDTADYEESKVKDIAALLEDYPALLPSLIACAEEIRQETRCPLCEALRLMIPSEMRGGRISVRTEKNWRVTFDPKDLETVLRGEKRSLNRRLVLTALGDGAWHSRSELAGVVRDLKTAMASLEEKGLVESDDREVLRRPAEYGSVPRAEDPVLTAEQEECLEDLLPALRRGEKKTFLLHGVTGSGKTEVFIRLVRECADMGKSALILVPEIALTPQMITWFQSRFGDALAVLHSRLTAGERFDEWRRIRFGQARIVIGARSAVFAPVTDLGAVIIDEEHETTYYSDHYPQYDARRVARGRIAREGGLLLLSSATPSIYSYAMARRGDYTLLEMPHRVLNRPLPEIYIADMREELRRGNRGIFSARLTEELRECVGRGRQAMLFINRRGYAPFVSCRKCGEAVKCSNCDVSMTYHLTDRLLHCHYCGAASPAPETCPSCGSRYIKICGAGTQKVEEEVKKLFPDTGVIRMDNDTTSGRNAHLEMINRFRAGEAQILIGTQMIAKGLDFPAVTLVGAVLADMTLNLPDYRSAERTYQLLVQVAGRAGRGNEKGRVVIQTYKPEHYAIAQAVKQDYRAFFNEEFQRRRQDLYPPFTQLDRVLLEGPEEDAVFLKAGEYGDRIRRYLSGSGLEKLVLFVRSDMAPIARIQNRFRAHVILKIIDSPKCAPLRTFVTDMLREENETLQASGISAVFEINPLSLA